MFDRNDFLLLWRFHVLSVWFPLCGRQSPGNPTRKAVICTDGVAIQIECYSRDLASVIFWLPWKEKVSRTDSINSFFSEGKGITIHRPLSTVLYHMLLKKTALLLIYLNTSHWGKPKGGNNFMDNMQHAFYPYSKLLFWNYVCTKRQRQRWRSRSMWGFNQTFGQISWSVWIPIVNKDKFFKLSK